MEGQATEDGTANEQQTEGVTGISPHQNPEAASGALILLGTIPRTLQPH